MRRLPILLAVVALPALAQPVLVTDLRTCGPADAAVVNCPGPHGWVLRHTITQRRTVIELLAAGPRPGEAAQQRDPSGLAPHFQPDRGVVGPAGADPHAAVLRGSWRAADGSGRVESLIQVMRIGESGGTCLLSVMVNQPDGEARAAELAGKARDLPCRPRHVAPFPGGRDSRGVWPTRTSTAG
jgi:hypothetical protein